MRNSVTSTASAPAGEHGETRGGLLSRVAVRGGCVRNSVTSTASATAGGEHGETRGGFLSRVAVRGGCFGESRS